MGQCVSSQEERPSRGGGGGREIREERRSLMNHEGGFQASEGGLSRNGDRSHTSGSHLGDESVDGGFGREAQNGKVSGRPAVSELMNMAAGTGSNLEREVQQAVVNRPSITLPVQTSKGAELMKELSKAYRWRDQFEEPTSEFLALMDRLYMECQLHLTALSSRGDPESRREADTIVSEMVALRNYWGPRLLPSSTCNAFVRERIPLTLGVDQRQFRIDCAQFFEPVPFYGNQQSSCPGELMKLYRFSVYNLATNDVVLRYYLERSNVTQLYHVLCFMDDSRHGQVKPYGMEPPPYWDVRHSMLEDMQLRLLSVISSGAHPAPQPLAVTVFPSVATSGD